MPGRPIQSAKNAAGYTLVEMLATLVMVAIVLPVVIQGVTMSMSTSGTVIDRLQATALAESKLSELLATNTWNQPDLEGEFTTDQILAAGGSTTQNKDPNVEQVAATKVGTAGESNSTGDSPTSGGGAADPSRFRWAAEIKDWQDARVQQLDVTVTWEARGEEHSVTLSTLVQAVEQ